MRIRELLYRGEMVVVPPKVMIMGYPPVVDSRIGALKRKEGTKAGQVNIFWGEKNPPKMEE